MAVYRLHRKEWEKGIRPLNEHMKKRKRSTDEEDEVQPSKPILPGGGRKGVSSGLSTIVVRGGGSESVGEKAKWWKELGGKSKGIMRLKAG